MYVCMYVCISAYVCMCMYMCIYINEKMMAGCTIKDSI